ncbi:MAG: HipA domain-containing protein [Proteobacteria bacterium]|nr:HipA domain-containing protein [Pseudomonadota bacterium]
MKDRNAVIWTRLGAQPVKMGTLVVTDKEARFSYESDYDKTGLRGLGLVYPPDVFTSTNVRQRTEYFDFHPPIKSLVPSREERNFQRALLLKYLEKINVKPEPGFDTDWNILIHAGHGAIGHIDVFESDEAANQWYSTPSKKGLVELDDKFGFSLKEFMTWFDGDAELLIDILGPTPTVGGAIPKLPLSIDRNGWDGRIGLPTRFGDTGRTDILLKLENSAQYPGIIELETLGLDIHRAAGFDVPRYWPVRVKDLNALAIERFDRAENGSTVFMESIYSVLASGNDQITNHYSTTYDHIGAAIDSPAIQIITDRKAAKKHLLDRLILAMLTGNGDLHLENLSIIEQQGKLGFSPVYDPAPMRAYSIHNALFPTGMGFGDYGDEVNGESIGFKNAYKRFRKNLGISKTTMQNSIEHLLTVTDDYAKRIDTLETLPAENKANLIKIHQDIRRKFEGF